MLGNLGECPSSRKTTTHAMKDQIGIVEGERGLTRGVGVIVYNYLKYGDYPPGRVSFLRLEVLKRQGIHKLRNRKSKESCNI